MPAPRTSLQTLFSQGASLHITLILENTYTRPPFIPITSFYSVSDNQSTNCGEMRKLDLALALWGREEFWLELKERFTIRSLTF